MHYANGAVPVVTLRSFRDADRLRELAFSVRRVVIIGGGYVGLEMAETFRVLGPGRDHRRGHAAIANAFDSVLGELSWRS